MPHESLERNTDDLQGPSNRKFGLTLAAAFFTFSCWPILFHSSPRFWALVPASIFLVLALIRADALTVPNRLWLKLGLLLQKLVSPIALGILFYIVITPIGLFMRVLLRKELLSVSFNRGAQSYWIYRNPPGPSPDSLPNQF